MRAVSAGLYVAPALGVKPAGPGELQAPDAREAPYRLCEDLHEGRRSTTALSSAKNEKKILQNLRNFAKKNI